MKAILHLMIKALVMPFYKDHAGMLVFVFLIMFGAVESSQIVNYHLALIYAMLNSGIFLLIIFLIWLLYSLKSLHFLLKTSSQDAWQFLNYLTLLSAKQNFVCFFIISFLTFIPVFAYTIFIYIVGLQSKLTGTLGIIFIFQSALWLMSAWVLNYTIRNRHVASPFALPTLILPWQRTRLGIYAGYLIKEEKSAIILSKLFSLTLIYIVKETLETGDDFRIIGITWLFALLSHTYIIQKLKTFEDHRLQWTRSLPITITHTYATYLLLYALMMTPELILLSGTIGRGTSFLQLFLLPVFSSTFLVAIHTYLFKPKRDPDKFTTYLFWLFMVCFMLVLSKMIWVTAAVLIALSFLLFRKRFFLYEPVG
jgi:hypothetical protein